MQPFPDFDFLLKEELSPSENNDKFSLVSSSDCIPSPDTNNVAIDLPETPLIDFLESFQWMAENINDPLSIYEPISPAESPVARVQWNGSVSDRCSISSDYSSPSPPSIDSSPPSLQQSTSSTPEESVQDALAALERKLSQPTYTVAKDNEKVNEESQNTKPKYSYIAMIAKAILSTPQKRMILGDIYKYVQDNFPYYNNGEKAWRNSIRHNLSLNECFIKSGRCEGGKGNYWSIHPTCVEEFANGDYRRRQARKRVRRGMKNMVSALPLTSKESLSYVPMGTNAARNGYHPYAAPYTTYRNEMQYRNAMPSTPYNNTSPLNFNNTSPMEFNSMSHTSFNNTSTLSFNNTSPTGFNNTSPKDFNNTSPLSCNGTSYTDLVNTSRTDFNTTSPTGLNTSLTSVSSTSPMGYNSPSPASYSSTSPTNFNSITVDTSYGNNVTTMSYANHPHTAYGMQGNGFTYQNPQNNLLMQCAPLALGSATSTVSYQPNNVNTSSTLWNNAYGSNENYYGNVNGGLLKPAMNMRAVNNAYSLSC